ncbi:MAG: hypothetical protein LJE95_11920 [Acidobacteria bacterium]|nr:hypothetical protein [Acidobacteriota bacterium]
MLWALLTIIGLLTLPIGRAQIYRLQGNKLKVRRRAGPENAISLETDVGIFSLSPSKRTLSWRDGNGITHVVPFDRIRRIRLDAVNREDLITEIGLGFEPWDLFESSKDATEWWTVLLELDDFAEVPLFRVGQYQHRELPYQWLIDLEKAVLVTLGAMKYVDERARHVRWQIRDLFAEAGKSDLIDA